MLLHRRPSHWRELLANGAVGPLVALLHNTDRVKGRMQEMNLKMMLTTAILQHIFSEIVYKKFIKFIATCNMMYFAAILVNILLSI